MTGGASITGSGVLLYIEQGILTLSGDSKVNLTAKESGPYRNILAFQARGNSTQASLSGGSDWYLEGTVYIPDGPINLSDDAGAVLPLSIVADKLNMSGGSFVFKQQDRVLCAGG